MRLNDFLRDFLQSNSYDNGHFFFGVQEETVISYVNSLFVCL